MLMISGKKFVQTKEAVDTLLPTIIVKVGKLELAFQKSKHYIGREGPKFAECLQYILTHDEIAIPIVHQMGTNIEFHDGRHRFCVFRECNWEFIPVSVAQPVWQPGVDEPIGITFPANIKDFVNAFT